MMWDCRDCNNIKNVMSLSREQIRKEQISNEYCKSCCHNINLFDNYQPRETMICQEGESK